MRKIKDPVDRVGQERYEAPAGRPRSYTSSQLLVSAGALFVIILITGFYGGIEPGVDSVMNLVFSVLP